MLGDNGTGAGSHNRGGRGDIKRTLAVATGPAGIDGAFRSVDFQHAAAHRCRTGGDVGRAFADSGEADEETADRRVRGVAFHQLVERAGNMGVVRPLALAEGLQAKGKIGHATLLLSRSLKDQDGANELRHRRSSTRYRTHDIALARVRPGARAGADWIGIPAVSFGKSCERDEIYLPRGEIQRCDAP